MKNEKYTVLSHKFLGKNVTGTYTYEITFNKSLGHTGRFEGIEDGLNAYCKKEHKQNFTGSLKNALTEFWLWIKK